MTPELWRWLIGGLLACISGGMIWLVRAAYQIGATLTRIESRLGFHGELHDKHATAHEAHDERLREVEQAVARHSGQWGKV